MAAVLIAVALYVVENYGGNGFVPSWDQIYQWVGLEPSQSETTAPLPEGETEVVFLDEMCIRDSIKTNLPFSGQG